MRSVYAMQNTLNGPLTSPITRMSAETPGAMVTTITTIIRGATMHTTRETQLMTRRTNTKNDRVFHAVHHNLSERDDDEDEDDLATQSSLTLLSEQVRCQRSAATSEPAPP
ncbi:hypothetical protein ACJ73_07819, partial [Blastomyces percursus]